MKLARVFYALNPERWLDFPIAEGNSFANAVLQWRTQGFILDAALNAYVPFAEVKVAFQIETESTQGMTKQ
jgi:hypothetical protein